MYLGVDLGTSGLRAVLMSEDGAPVGAAERDYAVSRPHPGWSEQDPADWIAALEGAVQELRSRHSAFAGLRGVAVAGHMHGATLLDAAGAVLRPCILWNDTRAAAEAAALDAAPDVRRLSGNIVFPGFTAPKLDWVRRREPELFARVAKVLLPAGYLNFHLTGAYVADMSDSAGTSWLNVAARDWSEVLLAAGGMTRAQMPRLVEGAAEAGTLRPEIAAAWGVSTDVVVAGGAGDNAAAACGMGVLREGEGFVSLGTSGVVLMARDSCAPAPAQAVHTFCHAVPDRWYQMGVMLSATDCLNWLARIAGRGPEALADAVGDVLRPPGRETFLPYLSGERTPYNRADLRASFGGVGVETDLAALTRAVMTGVAFGLRDCAEALSLTGARFERLCAIGGGAQSAYWLKLLATALDAPLTQPKGGEFGAALGAARLALVATTGAESDQAMPPPAVGAVIEPERSLVAAYEEAYQEFRNAAR